MNIWKNVEFTKFFVSFTVGNIGDWFDIFALQIILVHEWHASPIVMGLLLLVYFLPAIVLNPIAGVWADKVSKRNLMIYTDLIAALLTMGLFLSTNITQALIILFIRSCIVSINSPAQQAYIKCIVKDDHLLQASSYTTVVFQMCKVVGPMLGALVLIIASARMCLAINACSFIFSAFILMTLVKDNVDLITQDQQQKIKHWMDEILAGAKYINQVRLMRFTLGIAFVWFFCSLVRQAQLAIYLKHLIPNKQDVLGIFMGVDGLGAVVTSSLLSRQFSIKNHALYFFLGFLLLGLGILGLGVFQPGWPYYLVYAFALIIGFGSGILLVHYSYIIKRETPKEQMGCVSGIASATQNVALTLGTLSSGFLVLQFGIREVYLGLAATMFILAVSSMAFMAKND